MWVLTFSGSGLNYNRVTYTEKSKAWVSLIAAAAEQ